MKAFLIIRLNFPSVIPVYLVVLLLFFFLLFCSMLLSWRDVYRGTRADVYCVSDFYAHIYLFIVRLDAVFFFLSTLHMMVWLFRGTPYDWLLSHLKVHVSFANNIFFSVILFASIHIKWDSTWIFFYSLLYF